MKGTEPAAVDNKISMQICETNGNDAIFQQYAFVKDNKNDIKRDKYTSKTRWNLSRRTKYISDQFSVREILLKNSDVFILIQGVFTSPTDDMLDHVIMHHLEQVQTKKKKNDRR